MDGWMVVKNELEGMCTCIKELFQASSCIYWR